MTEQSKPTPIAELTPEQFNTRFPVGTRVTTKYGEQEIMGAAAGGAPDGACRYVQLNITGWNYAHNVSPIVTLGSLNVGDEFRWHAETPGACTYRVEEMTPHGGAIMEMGTNMRLPFFSAKSRRVRVQVVALNLAQDRPEVFPGSMLRDGDVVELVSGPQTDQRDIDSWNSTSAPAVFKHGLLTLRCGHAISVDTVMDKWPRTHHWRPVPATIPAPAPTEPCPAPVEEKPEYTDEHLAAVAAVRELDKPRKCSRCKAPENKYRHLMPNFKNVLFCSECAWFGENNGTFLPPKPPRKLPAAVAYHLSDDADSSGLPSHD